MTQPLYLQRVRPFTSRKRRMVVPAEPDCPTFWGYVRVSDPKQSQNTSVETQPEEIRKAFETRWNQTHEFGKIVHDVASASKLKFKDRPGGKELLVKMRSGDVLVVTKVDRFSRNLVDGMNELRELKEKGIRVVCLDMNGLNVDFSGDAGELYLVLVLFGAQWEARRKRDRAMESWVKIKQEIAEGKRDPVKHVNLYSVRYGTKPDPKDLRSAKKRKAAPEWREFVRTLMALHTFACDVLGFSKADYRHPILAEKYGLVWWPGYSKRGPVGDKRAIRCDQCVRWFVREHEAQAKEGKTYPQPDEPWRRDFAAGTLTVPPKAEPPGWTKALNQPE